MDTADAGPLGSSPSQASSDENGVDTGPSGGPRAPECAAFSGLPKIPIGKGLASSSRLAPEHNDGGPRNATHEPSEANALNIGRREQAAGSDRGPPCGLLTLPTRNELVIGSRGNSWDPAAGDPPDGQPKPLAGNKLTVSLRGWLSNFLGDSPGDIYGPSAEHGPVPCQRGGSGDPLGCSPGCTSNSSAANGHAVSPLGKPTADTTLWDSPLDDSPISLDGPRSAPSPHPSLTPQHGASPLGPPLFSSSFPLLSQPP